jgi:hypothetical protein
MLVLVVLVSACVDDSRPESCTEAAVTIEVTLTESSMTPSDPGVCRDQAVTMVVNSDIDGFIHIHGYDEAIPVTDVTAGEEQRLEFVAGRSGQFPIEVHPADDPQGIEVGVFTVHEP